MSQAVEQLQQQLKGANAQIDAAKQMFNESAASNLQLRTNLNILQQMLQEANQKQVELNKTIETLTQDLADAKSSLEVLKPADAA